MVTKRASEPPPAPAAPSEEEESSSESIASEEEEEEEEEEQAEEEKSDDESESEPEKPQRQNQEQLKKQPLPQSKHTPPTSTRDPSSSGSESETESGSDSESEPETSRKPDPETLKSKKTKPHPPTPSKSTSLKRPSESGDSKKPDSKKKKSSHEGHETEDTGGPASEKKPLFQRVWSDEDEIALLKGMIDFAEKKGVHPSNRMSEFYEFVKKYIKINASQSQLATKIRGLKSRFKNSEGKGRNGQDRVSKKPHDQRAFELMKKLWGVDKGIVPDGGPKMNGSPKNKKLKTVELKEENAVSTKKDKDVVENSSIALLENVGEKVGPVSEESMCVIEASRLFPHAVDKVFLKGIGLIGEKKRVELEKRWMDLRVAEMKINEERAVLFHEQSVLIIDALSHKD